MFRMFFGKINDLNAELYWEIGNELQIRNKSQKDLQQDFKKAFSKAEELANRVQLKTPDPYLNTLGGALATAADGIWEAPAYLHGSVDDCTSSALGACKAIRSYN